MLSVLALGAADVEQAEQGSPPSGTAVEKIERRIVPIEATSHVRNLVLRAFGTGEEGPGQLRVPIPTDQGVTYEIIIEKPGLPRSVPAIKGDESR